MQNAVYLLLLSLLLLPFSWRQWHDLDGGALKPMMQFALVAINENGTFLDVFHFNRSVNMHSSVELNSSERVWNNATFHDPGPVMLQWYLSRLWSQSPLFVVAVACCLLLVFQLLAAWVDALRSLGQNHQQQQQQQQQERKQQQIKSAGFTVAACLLLLVFCVLLFSLHAAGRAGMQPLMSPRENDTGRNMSAVQHEVRDDSTLRLVTLVRQTVRKCDTLLETFIVDTNSSVAQICKEMLPETVKLVRTVGTRLLNLVAEDLHLAPLLKVLDSFMEVIRGIVGDMRKISAARETTLKPLTKLTVNVENVKEQVERIITDACKTSDAKLISICSKLRSKVADFVVGVNAEQVDSDSSVAVVTLLRKLNVNISEVDSEIAKAKSQLYGSLDIVGVEIGKLFDQAVVQSSRIFSLALVEAEDVRRDLRRAGDDKEFLRITGIVDFSINTMTYSTYCVIFITITLLFIYLVCSVILLSRSLQQEVIGDGDGNGNGNGNSVNKPVEEEEVEMQLLNTKGLNTNHEDHHHNANQLRFVTPRRRLLHILTAFGCVQLIFLLFYGFALMYTGYEMHTDACRYITQPEAIDKIDEMLQQLATSRLWPLLQQHLQQLPIEFPLQQQQVLPHGAVRDLLQHCGNESLTAAEILNLGDVLNVTQLLQSPVVDQAISDGRNQMLQMVRQQTNSTGMIPPEAESLMQKTLPQFASIVDSQDFSSSIANLQQRLLPPMSQLAELSRELLALAEELKVKNSSDTRIVLLGFFSQRVMEIFQDGQVVQPKLQLLQKSFSDLQERRIMSNLTVSLIACVLQLKQSLTNQTELLRKIGQRFDQVVEEFLPIFGHFGQRLLHRVADRIGGCKQVPQLLQPLQHWCQQHTGPVAAAAATIIAVCLLLHCVLLLLLPVLPLVRARAPANLCYISLMFKRS